MLERLQQLQQQLARDRHRALIVFSGDWSWCLQACLQQLPAESANHAFPTLWLGEDGPKQVTEVRANQATQWLGQQCQQLVINGFGRIDLNAIGALTGTVKAGGVCVLLCPPLTLWQTLPNTLSQRFCAYPDEQKTAPSRWIKHLINTIEQENHCLLIQQGQPIPALPHSPATVAQGYQHPVFKTEQQQLAVTKIKKVATGHRRRPLVLTADRGRGKSSALGIAMAELLLQGKTKVIISALQVASVAAVFARAAAMLDVISQSPTQLLSQQGLVQFVPPDELIRHKYDADLVAIDEAAAIPAPMLSQILQRYSRLVFTSTIHGYEGTGRGFEIRFKHTLNQLTPNWQAYTMDEPIRWAKGDPLENFVNKALMLDAQAAIVAADLAVTASTFTQWDRDQLLQHPQHLSQIFGLLMLSHYKTSPNDLAHLLDGSNIQVCSLAAGNAVVGTVLLALEGNIPEPMAQQIWQGKRRLKGHLLAQTLSYHGGFAEAALYRYVRVIRIAVHPQLHGQGLGSQMLTLLSERFNNMDFIGSSFGATAPLLQFWQRNQFSSVRLGVTEEATSNEYSAVVLRPLSQSAESMLARMRGKFESEFAFMLKEFYPRLPISVIIQLLKQSAAYAPILTLAEQHELQGYINCDRDYDLCCHTLYKQALIILMTKPLDELNQQQRQLLVDKVLRRHDWHQVCQSTGFVGKKGAALALKNIFAKFV